MSYLSIFWCFSLKASKNLHPWLQTPAVLKTRCNDQRLAIWQPRLGAHRMVLLAYGCNVLAGNVSSAAKCNDHDAPNSSTLFAQDLYMHA